MKPYSFDDALKVLAKALERDAIKKRRAKKDRRTLNNDAVRRSLRSAAQAYIANKEHWGIGPAKIRDRYISMYEAPVQRNECQSLPFQQAHSLERLRHPPLNNLQMMRDVANQNVCDCAN